MSGWKTWTAGLGSIFSGAALVLKNISGDDFNFDEIKQGLMLIIAGLGILGIGHKVEKAS